MSIHAIEEEMVASLSQRAFLVGYLFGILGGLRDALEEDRPALSADIDWRLEAIYPLIEKEFYLKKQPSTETTASWKNSTSSGVKNTEPGGHQESMATPGT